eukprot:scaffold2574_cov110-Isochrysis_galbana.AAC.2
MGPRARGQVDEMRGSTGCSQAGLGVVQWVVMITARPIAICCDRGRNNALRRQWTAGRRRTGR